MEQPQAPTPVQTAVEPDTPLSARQAFRTKYGHWLYALILPVYLIAFFTLQHFINGTQPYFVSYLPLDDLIPFCEWFYFAYITWYPFMGAVGFYLLFRDPDGFRKYMTYIGVSFFTSILIFIVFRSGQNLRPDLDTLGRSNLATEGIRALYAMDPNVNVCPSIHVVGTIAVLFGVFENRHLRHRAWITIPSCLIATLIVVSTVLIKQHSVLDIFVAIPYALGMYLLVYRLPGRLRRRKARTAKEK